ncbi:MAG: hypothetical protein WCO45_12065 [Pseudanabaena sp. ELA607]|jgi:hypothetical protein
MLKHITTSAIALSLVFVPTLCLSHSATAETLNAPTSSISKIKNEWDFTVTNNGSKDIIGLEAREINDGQYTGDWRPFSGSSIAADGGRSAFKWSSSTNDSSCTWAIRAIYADGYSAPAAFNFCKETNLVFNN